MNYVDFALISLVAIIISLYRRVSSLAKKLSDSESKISDLENCVLILLGGKNVGTITSKSKNETQKTLYPKKRR